MSTSITRRAVFARSLPALALTRAALAQSAPSAYLKLVAANDLLVDRMLADVSDGSPMRSSIRRLGTQIESLTAALCAAESKHYQAARVRAMLEQKCTSLAAAQHADGTIDSGNLNSPPDTGFLVETAATALAVLRHNNPPQSAALQQTLQKFLLAAGEPLITGGVHTPNHRWVICAALSRIHSLFPSPRYVARIDEWLSEGIDIDADGQYSERSTGIYSRVTDTALVTMARLLRRPELLNPVRRNLDLAFYFAHADGEMETVASRRQDAGMRTFIAAYYLEYRYLAVRDKSAKYAAIVRWIEETQLGNIPTAGALLNILEEPVLRAELPAGTALETDFARSFPATRLARFRRGEVSATIFGGSDWPAGVASGLSSTPTFFTFRKGKAVLESIRMGGMFFSEGAFRSEGLKKDGDRYVLQQRFDVPYYQPLPKALRKASGDYPLTPARDARFWSKLDFPHRPMSQVQTLDQMVTIVEKGGAFELRFDITGHAGVPFTIELAFRPGGVFSGTATDPQSKANFLREGQGRYQVGSDGIEFGPGQADHAFLNLAGPSYAAHGAPLQANGDRVYITGMTPFHKVLTIRAL